MPAQFTKSVKQATKFVEMPRTAFVPVQAQS
jgi:hypothetical protein